MRAPALTLVLAVGTAAVSVADEWVAPPEERAKTAPFAASAEGLAKGQALYKQHCGLCHGDKGKGDGPLARFHTQRTAQSPFDLSSSARQTRLTDGEIFWKVTTGLKRNDQVIMPAFGEQIGVPEDRWYLVQFVRTLREGGAPK